MNRKITAGIQLLCAALGACVFFLLRGQYGPESHDFLYLCVFDGLAVIAALALFISDGKWIARLSIFAFAVQAVYHFALILPIIRYARAAGPFSTALYFAAVPAFVISVAGLCLAMKAQRVSLGYIILYPMSVIWLFPIFYIVMTSFRADKGSYSAYLIPRNFTLDNYTKLLHLNADFPFIMFFKNTLFVSVCSCLLTSFIVLSTAFALSRLRFDGRKTFMSVLLVLGMFPGFMAMIAVYYILKGLEIEQSLIALVMVYSGGGALTYYIAKGFFDTIPASLDEAAFLDGATKWQLFTRITLPLSKPIIVYTMLISFIMPWSELIFAQIILGDKRENWTVGLGLYTMLERQYIDKWYTAFAAGAVMISIPIAFLFVLLQRFYIEGLSGGVKG